MATRAGVLDEQTQQLVSKQTDNLRKDAETINATNTDAYSAVLNGITAAVSGLSLQSALDGSLISDIAQIPDYAKNLEGLAKGAIEGVADPGLITGLAGSLATGVVDRAKASLPNSVKAFAFSPIINKSAAGDILSSAKSRTDKILHGDGASIQETSRSTYDGTKSAFNSAYGLAGMAIGFKPEIITGTISTAARSFQVRLDFGTERFVRIIEIQQRIIDLLGDLPSQFAKSDYVGNVRKALTFSTDADQILSSVRSQMITRGVFPRGFFNNAKLSIKDADEALAGPPDERFPLAEIFSLLDEMERQLKDLEKWLDESEDRSRALIESLGPFIESRVQGAMFAGLVQFVQNDLRSLIENMEAALSRPFAAFINPMIPLWRTQLQLIYNTMCGLGDFIAEYLDEDPEGLIGEINIAIAALENAPILRVPVEAFISASRQFGATVQRILDTDEGFLALAAFAAQAVVSRNASVIAINGTSVLLNLFPIPSDAILNQSTNIAKMLDQFGLDRAAETFRRGDFEQFWGMTALASTFSGAALEVTTGLIECIREQPTVSQEDLVLAEAVRDKVLAIRQQEQLAAQTFNQWKRKAVERINQVQLPELDTLSQQISQLNQRVAGTVCGEETI